MYVYMYMYMYMYICVYVHVRVYCTHDMSVDPYTVLYDTKRISK